MNKLVVTLIALCTALALAFGALPIVVVNALASTAAPSQAAITEIPPTMLAHYQAEGSRCPAITWSILAGIGEVESGHGQKRINPTTGDTIGSPILGFQHVGPDTDHGYYDHDPERDWAVGPMQITPATFDAYATIGTDRPAGTVPDPSNAWDAIATAANYLCDLDHTLGLPTIERVLTAYNCGPAAPQSCGGQYATQVVNTAGRYAGGAGVVAAGATGDVATVIATALAQLGKPYVFGTQGPDTFDCAGLITYAYRSIGIDIPAYTFTQVTYGTAVPVDQIQPGDLIFTRGGMPAEDFGHVALAISPTQEVQAPRTGDVVRVVAIGRRLQIQAVRRLVASAFRVAAN